MYNTYFRPGSHPSLPGRSSQPAPSNYTPTSTFGSGSSLTYSEAPYNSRVELGGHASSWSTSGYGDHKANETPYYSREQQPYGPHFSSRALPDDIKLAKCPTSSTSQTGSSRDYVGHVPYHSATNPTRSSSLRSKQEASVSLTTFRQPQSTSRAPVQHPQHNKSTSLVSVQVHTPSYFPPYQSQESAKTVRPYGYTSTELPPRDLSHTEVELRSRRVEEKNGDSDDFHDPFFMSGSSHPQQPIYDINSTTYSYMGVGGHSPSSTQTDPPSTPEFNSTTEDEHYSEIGGYSPKVGSVFPPARRAGVPSRLPNPVPVPNVTKPSRGRRVPTAENLDSPTMRTIDGVVPAGNARTHVCNVEGCGKVFARGEHLRRHVRGIHTYEKPHKCPYLGCGKDFSRADNLNQHIRVHSGHSRDCDPPQIMTPRLA